MIRVSEVRQHYGVRPVLKEIDLEIRSGELVPILGPNGMGKTTLMAVMAGVLQPQKRYVEIDEMRRRRTWEEELGIRKTVAYVR